MTLALRSLVWALAAVVALTAVARAAPPLAERIGHTDPARYTRSRSHGSAGDMACMSLIGAGVLPFLNFVHRCRITAPHGGVGLHAHDRSEELFVIFDGEAEFTVDGHTTLLPGPVGVPLRLGHSHAILNPTAAPIEFLNANVTTVDGEYDARDLGDARVGVEKEPVPAFTVMRLDRSLLGPRERRYGGVGTARYRRALGPGDFSGRWSYVDHLVLPAGAAEGLHSDARFAEVYYVMNGRGEIVVGGESSAVRAGDAVPILAGEAHSIEAEGAGDLELLIIGIDVGATPD